MNNGDSRFSSLTLAVPHGRLGSEVIGAWPPCVSINWVAILELSQIRPYLPEEAYDCLCETVASLEVAVAKRSVPNAFLTEAKRTINDCVDAAVSRYDDLHYEPGRGWQVLVMGARNLPTALKESVKAGAEQRTSFLRALLPVNELLQSAKPHIVMARRKASLEEQHQARLVGAMTCQCCGRPILAETGVIAHHGFLRREPGVQTESCSGASHLPFEADRSHLGDLISGLRGDIERLKLEQGNIEAETASIFFYIPQKHGLDVALCFTRDTFDEVLTSNPAVAKRLTTFDALKQRELTGRAEMIRSSEDFLWECEQRFAGWKQTHRWEAGKWVALKLSADSPPRLGVGQE